MSTRSNKQMEDIQHDILHAKPGAAEIRMSPLHQSPRPESVGIRKSIQTPCEKQENMHIHKSYEKFRNEQYDQLTIAHATEYVL